MNLNIKPITDENRDQALALRVAAGQEGFVESVSQCLEEAARKKCWRPVGIYDGETMVGFAMYGYFFWEYFPIGRVWMDRLLIDRHCQGRGYGKAAMAALIEQLVQEYRCRKIYLSIIDGNDAAVHLYESFGFRFNGKKDIHGERIMIYCCKEPVDETPE